MSLDTAWPEPYLQPDRNVDCGFYANAYAARCLGFPDVTAEVVKAFRAATRYHESRFIDQALGLAGDHWNAHQDDETWRRRFWLGATARPWVEEHLAAGDIAVLMVHRIPDMGHAVVLLEDRGEAGCLLMDPIYGHVVESWDFILSVGPGHRDKTHHVEGWWNRTGGDDAEG